MKIKVRHPAKKIYIFGELPSDKFVPYTTFKLNWHRGIAKIWKDGSNYIASYYGASYIIYGNTKNRMSDALDSLEDIMLSLKKADIILPKRQ